MSEDQNQTGRFKNTVSESQVSETVSDNSSENKESLTSKSVSEETKKLEKNQEDLVLTAKEKNLSALGYISFLCVLPLCMEPNSSFCKFHGKQGMIITIVFFILGWIGWFSPFLRFLLFLLHVGLMVWGIMNAIQGKIIRIPFAADVADKLEI